MEMCDEENVGLFCGASGSEVREWCVYFICD